MGKGTYYGKSCTRGTADCRYRSFKIDYFRQKQVGRYGFIISNPKRGYTIA